MSLFYGNQFGWYGGSFGGILGPIETAPIAPEAKADAQEPLERVGVISSLPYFNDWCADAPPPTMPWLRVMRTHPVVSFSLNLVIAPILAGERTLVIRESDGSDAAPRKVNPGMPGVAVGEGPEDKRKKRDEDVFETLWPQILEAAECVHFGHWDLEVLWARDTARGVTAPVRFKSVAPWEAELQRDKFNDFAGLKFLNGNSTDNERDARYVFHAAHGRQFNGLTGWGRGANALRSWWRYIKSHENADRIEQKASGRQMLMLLANGKTQKNNDGSMVEFTKQEAQEFANSAAQGKVLQAPMFAFTLQAIKGNKDLAAIPAIKIEPIDWGDTGPSLIASKERRAELAVEIVRAYLHPEREAMEGQHGTKAEAGVHGQVGVTDCELVGASLYDQFNQQTYNRYLVTNEGPQAAGTRYWKMSPLADPQQTFLQDVAKALFASPTTGPTLEARADLAALLKRVEMPQKPEDQIPELPPMPTAADAGGADPLAKRNAGAVGANGNGQAGGN